MISFQYFYNTVLYATNGGNMEAQSKAMNEIQFRDIEIKSFSGWLGLFLHLIVVPVIGLLCFVLYAFGGGGIALGGFFQLIIAVVWFMMWNSYVIINPNEAAVLQFFGKYVGSAKTEGFRWFVNPLYEKTKVIFRIRNFESAKLKVNDVNANPIDIAAVVVWRVFDAAEALFEVDDYENYVQIQSEAALRAMATKYPYDIIEEKDQGGVALSSHQEVVASELRESVQGRLSRAGIEVLEARISHLAYAPEVAQAMLRRQQASAVVAARREIVDGAVGMVELALDQLSIKGIIELDEDKKATMVSNLLVVLCSETDTTPVVNTGSLYQ